VKHILNRHRGVLHVESRLGQGSTFTVYLPVTITPVVQSRPGLERALR
jgi:two-component system phosphate regulon sensor histidine kinase PhoR